VVIAMRATTRKTLRDLVRQRGQVFAVGLTVALGVALYVSAGGAFHNLSASYQQTYDRLHFADLVATGPDAQAAADAALAAGATTAITRVQSDEPMRIDGTTLLGRVVALPDEGHPAVDDVAVIEGSYLDAGAGADGADGLGATDQVLVERHAADAFGLVPGDTVEVFGSGMWHTATVQGIVVSPEYIWAARSRQEVVSDPHSFAVVYASAATTGAWLGDLPAQTLVLLPEGTAADALGAVANAMRGAGALDVTTWTDQASHATLQEDLDGFSQMSVAFPLLFLAAAGIASYVMLARRILRERPVIGTLMASGARRGRVMWHYLSQGLLVGLLGSVVGVGLGAVLNGAFTSAYTRELGIPDTVVRTYPLTLLYGVLFGAAVGVLGALAPAISASRTAPAAAMRSASPTSRPGPWARLVARMTFLSVSTRMALRDVGRNPRRTFATALGGVLALVVVISALGMSTTMLSMLDTQFNKIELEDASVTVATGGADARALADVAGVASVEPTTTGAVTVLAAGGSYASTLQGFEPSTVMHGFLAPGGGTKALPADGVLAGKGLADVLDVAPGDSLIISSGGSSHEVRLVGFVDQTLGTSLYGTLETVDAIVPRDGTATYLLSFDTGADRDALRNTLTGLDGVVAYQDTRALMDRIDSYMGLFWVFIVLMIGLGVVLSLAVIYVTMAVGIAERTGELATLRAAGVSVGKVARTIATENLVATALGLPFGLALGTWAAWGMMRTYSSDLFSMPLTMPWWLLPACALGVMLAAALSQWPAVRAVRRVDVATVVRERAV